MLTIFFDHGLANANLFVKRGVVLTKEQWLAIKNNDKAYDGKFYYALKRSKKVCRPSCRKTSLRPERVIIFQIPWLDDKGEVLPIQPKKKTFDTLQEALDRGYQPCSRCRPDKEVWKGARIELANAAERLVRENYRQKFSLPALAGELYVDKSYLLRTFKEIKGYTLLEFHNIVRTEKAKEMLQRPELPIAFIASEAGYVSASHFTQVFRKVTGQTPSQYRAAYLRSLDE